MAAALNFDTFANVIDGKLVSTTKTRTGINPATREPLPAVPVSTHDDVDKAIEAAKRAASSWGATTLADRQDRLSRFADAILANADAFAKMLTLEQGKPLTFAKDEVAQAVGVLKGVAALPFPESNVIEDNEERRVVTRYVPIGVCVGIVPWNFPLALGTFKLGPAVLTGNTIILKPSPFTPYCGTKFAELAQQFFPPGVVQSLSGDDDLGPWLTAHPGVDKVSFTGSTATGIRVMQSCAKTLKRVTLELGGNDAAIILPDVDVNKVAPQIAQLALYNSGQVCIAIKRIYIHSSIYKEFVAAMLPVVKSLVVADGMDASAILGPVQNSMQYEKVKDLVASLDSEKLDLLTGDTKDAFSNTKGYFINPIVVNNPPDTSRIVVEEPFGPVFPVMQWDDEQDVIRRANSSNSGLGASVWSNDLSRADNIAKQLQSGSVWINSHMQLRPDAAFGGHKHSGIGSELGVEGLKAYCNVQSLHCNKVKL